MHNLPSWLDPASEIPRPAPIPKPASRAARVAMRRAFVAAQDKALRALGVDAFVRAELIAIAITECADGRSAGAQVANYGGAKVKQDIAAWHLRSRGHPMAWFRAAGHVKSGDAPEVLYCAFGSADAYWSMALARVFGTAIAEPWERRYRETARRLWAHDSEFVAALIAAGYRGGVTQRNPGASIAAHYALAAEVRGMLARAGAAG
jgi:hypothetical protein